jgi:hypothetical protein
LLSACQEPCQALLPSINMFMPACDIDKRVMFAA